MKTGNKFFDSSFAEKEQLPRFFTVSFDSVIEGTKHKAKISINGSQVGDIMDDNARQNDFYRFHDVFHYTFATILGWSPCARSMMKRKRKSVREIDETEDGARATITEEAISLIIFNKAKQNDLFKNKKISRSLLMQIKELTSNFEVSARSTKDWEKAISTGYSLFRELTVNDGGRIHFDMKQQTAFYEKY